MSIESTMKRERSHIIREYPRQGAQPGCLRVPDVVSVARVLESTIVRERSQKLREHQSKRA